MKEMIIQAVNIRMPNKEIIRAKAMEKRELKSFKNLKAGVMIAAVLLIAVVVMAVMPMLTSDKNGKKPPVNTKVNGVVTIESDTQANPDSPETTTKCDDSEPLDSDTEYYDPNALGGNANACYVHCMDYHAYPAEIEEYIGQERLRDWADQLDKAYMAEPAEGDCPRPDANIFNCVEYFNVDNEIIIAAYENNSLHWDIDALLARDYEGFEAWARNCHECELENNREYQVNVVGKQNAEITFKKKIISKIATLEDEASKAYYNEITDGGKTVPYGEYTILDLVENTSLTREDLAVLLPVNREYGNGSSHYVYNLDLLFEDKAVYKAEIAKLTLPADNAEAVTAIDALLHIETRLSVTEVGVAVKTADGIYIPEFTLPLNNEERTSLDKAFIVYDGNVYIEKERIYCTDKRKGELIDPNMLGDAKFEFIRNHEAWEIFTFNDFSSNIKGEVYALKSYDSSYRIALLPQGEPYMIIFENYMGKTLKNGSQVFGKNALDLKNNYTKAYINYGTELPKEGKDLLGRFIDELSGAEFIKKDIGNEKWIPITFEMKDGSRTTVLLYKNGYVEYELYHGYSVYLRISDDICDALNTDRHIWSPMF